MTMHSLPDVLAAYGAAWTEPAAEKRMALLKLAWSEDGIYRDPSGEARGRIAFSEHIGRFHAQQPGVRIEVTSGASEHHGHIYFSWHMINADWEVVLRGVDFGTLDSDGRLKLIVGFFGPPRGKA